MDPKLAEPLIIVTESTPAQLNVTGEFMLVRLRLLAQR
jgi:hypothetical protein